MVGWPHFRFTDKKHPEVTRVLTDSSRLVKYCNNTYILGVSPTHQQWNNNLFIWKARGATAETASCCLRFLKCEYCSTASMEHWRRREEEGGGGRRREEEGGGGRRREEGRRRREEEGGGGRRREEEGGGGRRREEEGGGESGRHVHFSSHQTRASIAETMGYQGRGNGRSDWSSIAGGGRWAGRAGAYGGSGFARRRSWRRMHESGERGFDGSYVGTVGAGGDERRHSDIDLRGNYPFAGVLQRRSVLCGPVDPNKEEACLLPKLWMLIEGQIQAMTLIQDILEFWTKLCVGSMTWFIKSIILHLQYIVKTSPESCGQRFTRRFLNLSVTTSRIGPPMTNSLPFGNSLPLIEIVMLKTLEDRE